MSHRTRCLLAALFLTIAAPLHAQTAAGGVPTPVPWTHLRFNDDPARFQFGIISDRNGGMRPGVFEKGVRRLNLLQPEFVLCVGDLISGYTEDEARMDAEWDEFDRIAAEFEMPFFYLAGNHDITNPAMAVKWRQRYGAAYHHFVYRGVLFLLLNSEDPKAEMSPQQLESISEALAANPDARWTVVLIHRPLWGRGAETNGWNRVEELLGDRPYTVFAGHWHRYLNTVRNGRQYYVLATTGGGSNLTGVEAGQFDHVTWVTMTDAGPVVANLLLDGILPGDVRTDGTAALTDPLFRRQAVLTGPLYTRNTTYSGQSTTVRFLNPGDRPLKVTAGFQTHENFRPAPRTFGLTVPPGEERQATVTIGIERARKLTDLSPLFLDWTLQYDLADRDPLKVEGRNELLPEQVLQVRRVRPAPRIDGRLDEWKRLPLGDDAGASPRFAVGYDGQGLYVAAAWEEGEGKPLRPNTGIRVYVDARPDPERSQSQARETGALDLRLKPGEPFPAPGYRGLELPEGLQAVCDTVDGGLVAEVRLPAAWLDALQGARWKAVRLNLAVHHYGPDAWRGTHNWWRPDWRSPHTYAGSGTFLRQ